jgi:hypothetical protein
MGIRFQKKLMTMDNYPPGAANDPDAPYNQPLDEDEEIALLQAIYYPKKKTKSLKNDASKQ